MDDLQCSSPLSLTPFIPLSKEHWFPTFVGMVKGEKVTSLRGGENLRGATPPLFLTPLSSHKIYANTVGCFWLERGYRGEVSTIN
jgi:hypothetical protein